MRGKHKNHVRSEQHHRWSNRLKPTDQGYIKIRVGRNHPLADANGYAYEHHVVLASSFGAGGILDGMIVHHKNGNKSDNRLENLDFLTRAEHNRHHNKTRRRLKNGQFARGDKGDRR